MAKRPSIQARFGARVRTLRRAAALTQETLAKKAGVDWKYLGLIERGKRNVTIGMAERLATALGVEPLQLFLFDEPGVARAERVTAAWIADRLGACPPERRKLAATIAALAVKLAGGDERSR
jgi:transcriptional regulator with XRE-family HTH domain